jgi:uncharacterized protein YkwD
MAPSAWCESPIDDHTFDPFCPDCSRAPVRAADLVVTTRGADMATTTRWIAAVVTAMALASGTAAFADGTADDSSSSDQAAPAAPAPPKAGYSATGTWQLLALVNKRRHAMGLRPLAVDSRLAGIARSWAERMAAQNDLRHNDPLFSRSSHVQLHMKALGENVGWNYSVADQNAAFIASPLHRSNMQLATFRVAGFAVVRDASGRIWSTEDYGTPSG